MKKKILSAFLAAIMMLSAIPVFAQTYTVVDGFTGATCESYAQKVTNPQLMTGTIENDVWTVKRTNTTTSTGVLGSVLTLPREINFSDGPFRIEFSITDNSDSAVNLGVIGFSDGRNLTANDSDRITGVLYSNQYFGIQGTGTNKTNLTTNGGYSAGVDTRETGKPYSVKMDFRPSENEVDLNIDNAGVQTFDLSSKSDYTKLSHMVVSFSDKVAGEIVISDLKIAQEELGMQASVEGNAVKVAFDSAVDASTLNGVFTSNPACDIEVSYDDASKIATLTGFDYGTAYTVTADVSKINAGKDGYLKRAAAFSANVTTESYVSDVVYSEDFESYNAGDSGDSVFQYIYVTNKDSSNSGKLPKISTSVDTVSNEKALKVIVDPTANGQSILLIKLPKKLNYIDGKTTISAKMTVAGLGTNHTFPVLFGVTSSADGIENTYSNTCIGYGKMGIYTSVKDSNLRVFGSEASSSASKSSGNIMSDSDFTGGKSVKLTYTIDGSSVAAKATVDGTTTDLTFNNNETTLIKNGQTSADYLVFNLSRAGSGTTTYYLDDITITQESSAKVGSSTAEVYAKKPIEIKSNLLLDASTVTDTNVTVSDGTNAVACSVALAKDKQTILVTPESEWVAGKEYTVTIDGVTVLNAPTKELAATVTVNALELISDLSATASGTDVTVSAALSDSSFDGVIIAALYNAQNVLLGVVILEEPASSISETITAEENATLTDAKIKMFAWNSISTMVPVTGKKECSVN